MIKPKKDIKNVHDYLNNLDEKVKKAQEASADTPKIGIFWLHLKDGQIKIFWSDMLTLEFGEDYGDFIVAPREHSNAWENLKRHGIVPKNLNYEDLPRGRVAYDKKGSDGKGQYVVFIGDYIKASSTVIKNVIKSEFKLKANTRWVPDLHYNKPKRWGF